MKALAETLQKALGSWKTSLLTVWIPQETVAGRF
jgi:hypothetical protein